MRSISPGRCLSAGLILICLSLAGCSRDPKRLIARGEEYLAQGKYREAIIEFRNAVKAAPNLPETHYRLALAHLTGGEFELAYQNMLKAAQLDPDNLEAQLRLANLQMLDRKFDEARVKADIILKRDQRNIRAHILRGNTYSHMLGLNSSLAEMTQGFTREPRLLPSYIELSDALDATQDPKEAEKEYRKAADLDPNSIEAKLALANFYIRKAALAADKKAAEPYNTDAERLLRAALALDPKSVDANNARGFFYTRNDRIAEAEKIYAGLRDLYPNEVRYKIVLADFWAGNGQLERALDAYRTIAAGDAQNSLPRKRLANIYLSRNEIEKATQLKDEILKIDAKDADAQLIQGRILLIQGKIPEAVKTLEAAINARPISAEARYFHGIALLQMQPPDAGQAEKDLSRALRIDPSLMQAHVALAQLKLSAGDSQAALKSAREVTSQNMKLDEALLNEARLTAASALLSLNDYRGAAAELDEFVRRNPGNARGLHLLGLAYQAQGNTGEAEAKLEAALKADPRQFDSLSALSRLYVSQKDSRKAVQRVEQAIAQNPKEPKIYEILGQTYLALNDKVKAEEAYVRAASIDPGNVRQRQILADFYSAVGKPDKSVATLEAISKEQPANAAVKLRLADVYLSQKQIDRAVALADETLKSEPNNAAAQVLKGRILLTQNKNAEAVAQFQSAVKTNRGSAEARYFLGVARMRSGDRAGAENEWTEASRNPGRFFQPVLALAQLKLEAGDADSAIKYAKQVATIAPQAGEAQLILGAAYGLKRNYTDAAKELEEYVGKDPSDPRGAQRLGAVYLAQGKFASAETQFENALKADPGFVDALAGLASLYVSQKTPEKAVQRLNQRLAQVNGPAQAPLYRILGEIYLWQKDTARAEEFYGKAVQADPKNSGLQLALAALYERNGRPDKSADVLQNLLQNDPTNAALGKRVATMYLNQKAWDKGLHAIDGVMKANAKDTEARVLKIRLLGGQGKVDEALAEAKAAVNDDRNSAPARYALGLAYYLKDRRSPEIETAWNEATGLDPRYTAAYLALGQLKLDDGDSAAAARYAQQALRADPNLSDAHLMLGTALENLKDFKGAAAELEECLRRSPGNPAAQTRLGWAYAQQGDTTGAEKVLGKALKDNPNNTEALAALAGIALQKNPSKALQLINQQIARIPNQPKLYELLGQIYASQKDYGKAEQAYRKALSLDSTSLSSYGLLGQLFLAQNSVDKAIREYENAVKVSPKSVQTWIILGSLYELQKNTPKAMQNYREALRLDPQAPVAANNLAWSLAETGEKLDEALNLARMAHDKLPASPNAADTLGWVYYRRSAYRSAMDLFRECIEKEPKNPIFYYHMGMACFGSGDRAGAKASLSRALQLDPNFAGADQARAALQKP